MISASRPHHERTTAVHAGRADLVGLGVHALPIDLSSTYPLPDQRLGGAALQALAEGDPTAASSVYSRLHNPTVARFERALATLEGTEAAVAFASGMAAITAVLIAAAQTAAQRGVRGHVVALRPLYGGTDHLLACGMLGLDVTFTTADRVAEECGERTVLVLLETPSNPCLGLIDIAEVVRRSGEVPVAVDNTFATPILQNPTEFGAAYSVHSATKFLGGHGDVLAGVVACAETRAAALRQVRILTGSVLHPLAGYLAHRGLPTLPLRMSAAQETAGELARRLAEHPNVAAVHHPGLPGADPSGLLGRQMRGPGAILALETVGDPIAMIGKLGLITSSVSLGSTDTMIQHPASLTHRLVAETDRADCGITPNLVRLSVGLEHISDLWADLDAALRNS